MLKGVTKRIVEIRSPENEYFERAVFYLRTDKPIPPKREAAKLAAEYIDSLELPSYHSRQKNLRLTVTVLSLGLGVTLAALAAVLLLYTKM